MISSSLRGRPIASWSPVRFVKDEPLEVCGYSCAMVENTRVGKYFDIKGNRNVHYGPYPGCGNIPYTADDGMVETSSCRQSTSCFQSADRCQSTSCFQSTADLLSHITRDTSAP